MIAGMPPSLRWRETAETERVRDLSCLNANRKPPSLGSSTSPRSFGIHDRSLMSSIACVGVTPQKGRDVGKRAGLC